MTNAVRHVAIVGMGRLGTCMARALAERSEIALTLASARLESARAMAGELGDAVGAVPVAAVCDRAQLIVLTVPDAAIRTVCDQLPVGSGHAVVHTSGAIDRSALAAAQARAAATGVFHPLQAFPPAAPATRFSNVYIGIDAEGDLARELDELARTLGANTFSLSGVDRAGYHAAAVFASNYVVALHAAAARVWQQAGLPIATARAALAPLTRGALDAIAEHDLVPALTGPLARGDLATLLGHLQFLEADAASANLYRALAAELLRLPLPLAPDVRAALQRLIAGAP